MSEAWSVSVIHTASGHNIRVAEAADTVCATLVAGASRGWVQFTDPGTDLSIFVRPESVVWIGQEITDE